MSRVNESIFLYNGSLFFSSSSAKKIWPTFWKNSISWRVHYRALTDFRPLRHIFVNFCGLPTAFMLHVQP